MSPAWLDELALEPGPPWHHMGTRAISGEHLLLPPDEARDEQLALKVQLLREARETVLASLDAGDASEEAALVVAGVSSLESAALAVQEDLCILRRRDSHWRLDAGVVCFPSMWSLRDKLGQPLAAVHAPVPHYDDELADRVDRFVDKLRPERPVWRRNWFLHHVPDLHQPQPPPRASVSVPAGLWLRSERQSLSRLPRTDAVLFTIRTQQVPLAVVAERPVLAGAMASSIENWSPELVSYRSASPWRDDVLRWLREVAA